MDTETLGKNELKERFVELRALGFSYADIAEKLSVSKPTLLNWSRELSIDIQNARNLRMDELFQRFKISKEKRIEAFGKLLDAVLAEIEKRDLTQVRTEALFTLALKIAADLRSDYEPPMVSRKKSHWEDELSNFETESWEA